VGAASLFSLVPSSLGGRVKRGEGEKKKKRAGKRKRGKRDIHLPLPALAIAAGKSSEGGEKRRMEEDVTL